ncbi:MULTISPECIES: SixA phosphatase family protein [Actinomadura]|uniref:SixA phosphatase family protein n=1 Tax=Actinomadura yumaensis TaxID=111807 RepID=A0ABW2CSY2_9ACTN|nr:histidine phosphatase family protein [Actinomadura sp. J1-007]MWK35388.1 histidine phosphatase family protein [Actinomadura sp. J1-007]
MPKLIVLRHAKAAAAIGLPDHERPLADRGRRDAAATGDWLRSNDLVPGQVLCSTTVRTRQTLELLALDAETGFESRVYDNDPDDLLALVRENGRDDVGTLMVLGHNPSVHQVVHGLAGESPDAFPTCALAVIEVPGPWSETWPGTGTLLTTRTPKD